MEMLRQRIWKLQIFMWFIVITSLVSMAIVSVPVSALTAVVAAPVIVDMSLTPGSTFSIDITIANVENLWGYEVWVFYNTTILTATGTSSYDPFTNQFYAKINETQGYVYLAYAMPMGTAVGFSTVDPAPIAGVGFTVDAYGWSLLKFKSTKLSTPFGGPIAHDDVDGYFSNDDLLAKYNDLLAAYNTLNSTYHSLLTEYNNLLSRYNQLNSTYTPLLANYTSLWTMYSSLNSTYNSLKADYDDSKSKHEMNTNELSTARNINYLLVATTTIFIATTAYFILRKPKIRA